MIISSVRFVQDRLDELQPQLLDLLCDGLDQADGWETTNEGPSEIIDRSDKIWAIIGKANTITTPLVYGSHSLAEIVEIRLLTKSRNDFLSRASTLIRNWFNLWTEVGEIEEEEIQETEKGIEKSMTIAIRV